MYFCPVEFGCASGLYATFRLRTVLPRGKEREAGRMRPLQKCSERSRQGLCLPVLHCRYVFYHTVSYTATWAGPMDCRKIIYRCYLYLKSGDAKRPALHYTSIRCYRLLDSHYFMIKNNYNFIWLFSQLLSFLPKAEDSPLDLTLMR